MKLTQENVIPTKEVNAPNPSKISTNEICENGSTINKKIVQDLLALSSIENIEAGIIKFFIKKNNLPTIKNKLIQELINKDEDNRILSYFEHLNKIITVSDIERLFELLIPIEDKRVNGAVYTPLYIVDYIVDTTITHEGTVCDCSCGSGVFLLGALKKLRNITGKNAVELIEKNIYGVDILDYSVRRAKLLLSLYAVTEGEDRENIKFNIFCADSLESNWASLFPKIFERGGFDYVVGNPPYVRIQNLNSELKDKLAKKWQTIGTGNFNLYFAFFELGMQILKKDGQLGYITPNNYFTSLAGVELRKYFYQNKQIKKILNFNHLKLFENAQTYVCITFMSKTGGREYFEYCHVNDRSELIKLKGLTFSRYFYEWLDNKKWRLMTEKDYKNIKRIETVGTPLNKMCPIRVGIATLKNSVYFVDETGAQDYCIKTYKNKEYRIEKGILRKIIKISSINSENEIKNNPRRIIFPYSLTNGKYEIMTENELRTKYPACYQYLLAAKEDLEKRDKGRKTYPVWFAWGRTQGMNYKGKRLYTKTFSNKPNFMLDEDDNLFCNGYAVFCKNRINAIQKILNSKLMEYYVKKTSVEIEGNYQCYQKNFIEKFTIPNFSEEEWNYIENEKDSIKLNAWLFDKYGLIK